MGDRERTFFDRYQRDLSWGAFVFKALWAQQLGWSRLPDALQQALKNFGGIGPSRFEEPSEAFCHRNYNSTRQFAHRGGLVLIPLLELVNHSAAAKGFDTDDGVAVGGTFEDEVVVKYSLDDCWSTATVGGFFEPVPHAFSLAMKIQNEGVTVTIASVVKEWKTINGFPLRPSRPGGKTHRATAL
jgi:hypothetical protein